MSPLTAPGVTFRAGQVRFDVRARTLQVDGRPQKLGGRAFDLLAALVEQSDRVVSKHELMDRVWPGLVVEENNLQVHVASVRKILGADAIATVSGRGYRFTLVPDAPPPGGRSAANVPAASAGESSSSASLIGRESQTAFISGLVERADVRLVTLTGPAGCGKTRLGLHVLTKLAPGFADGSYSVMLAPLRSADHVASAIAQVLGVQQSAGQAMADLVVAHLAGREVLLMLDNFEHLLAAAPLVARILEGCPRVKVLVTSRSLLRVIAENDVVVPPLALPATKATTPQAAQSEAVRLFVARALAAGGGQPIAADDIQTVADICRRLEGMPLAIELAAARLRLLTPQALLARLDHRLDLLRGGTPNMPERQRTLRNAIAWSHDLLEAGDKVVFARLSVFAGGWSLEAADSVAADGPRDRVLDALERLVDQSLVQRVDDVSGEPRFTMLEAVREFAQQELQAGGEELRVRERHAEYFTTLAEREEGALVSARRQASLDLLRAELNNLREALSLLVSERRGTGALRLAGALPWMWYFEGLYSEGLRWLERALELPGDDAPSLVARAKAWSGVARLATYSGALQRAVDAAGSSISLWQQTEDRRGLGYALVHQAIPSMILRQQDAQALYERSLAAFREIDDGWGVALAVTYLGVLFAMTPGKEDAARHALGEGVARYEAMGDDWGTTATHYLGLIALRQGRLDEARRHVEISLAGSEAAGDGFRVSRGLHLLAEISVRQQRLDEAMTHLRRSIVLCREQCRLGDVAQMLRLAARIELGRQRAVAAARLLAAAGKLAAHRSTLPPDDPEAARRAEGELRASLGDLGFERESAYGAAQSLDETVAAIDADPAVTAAQNR